MVFLVGEKELRSGKPSVWARNALSFLSWRHRLLDSLKKGVKESLRCQYGVPYADAEGKMVMPDMGRVEATNGNIGYMAVDSIETAVFNGAKSPSEQIEAAKQNAIDEAKAFRSAFAEYYGIDALSDAAAYQCIIDVRYEGGVENAISAIEQDTKEFMLEVIRGDVAVLSSDEDDTVSNHLESLIGSNPSGEYEISEEAFEEILDIAKQSMMVSVPVYSVEGDVIGEYSFVRF